MKEFKFASCAVKNNSPDSAASVFAASELTKYLALMCKAEKSDSSNVISVGICDKITSKEDFAIASSDDGSTISITGGGERGVVYGVYTFLEKYCNCRFFAKDVERIPECTGINLDAPINFAESPLMEYRDLHWHCSFDPDWGAKNMLNSMLLRPLDEGRGGGIAYGGFVHTLGHLTGTSEHSQPCLSDPEMLKKTIAGVRAVLKKHPNVKIVSVSQNDNYEYCKCEKCAAVDIEEGSHMGSLLRFVNAVADDIKDDYPDIAIDTLAYQYTRGAPKITKPRDNVIIRLCTIECCFSHPLDECTRETQFKASDIGWKSIVEDMKDWGKICNRIYVWDYTTDYSHFMAPFPNFGVLRQNVRFFAENNVRGVFEQGNMSAISGEFGELRAYLLAKLLRYPYMTEAEYLEYAADFMRGYYGAGWTYVADYLKLVHEISKDTHFIIFDHPFKIMPDLSLETIAKMNAMWDSAEKLAVGADELGRVRRSRLCARYFESLILDREMNAETDETKKAAMKADIAKFNRALYDDVKSFGIITIREWTKLKSADEIDFTLTPETWNG